jgi:hypothetical protein
MGASTLIRGAVAGITLALLLLATSNASADPPGQESSGQETSAASEPRTQETEAEPAQIREPEAVAATDEVRFRVYGRLKADASLDTSLIDPGNFARWVESPDLTAEHSHFNLTVRESRVGLDVTAPGDGPRISGHVEIDFYGGGTENRNIVQLRHAHIDVDWDDWSLVAGQFSDVISPLVPTTVNYSVAWWAGNMGYRRPQVRITRRFGDSDGWLVLTAAVTRTIGDAFAEEPGDSGVDSGRPTLQGRAAWEWTAHGRRGGVGISGHQGSEDLRDDFGDLGREYDSWSVGGDLMLPLGERWLVKAEAWTGENLDDYLGGIGQGLNLERATGVRATGGWGSVEFRPSPRLLISAGAGVDDPDDGDLPADQVRVRTYNRALWANAIIDLGRGLSTGFELSHWRTDHGSLRNGDAFRFQAALIFLF